ncbi:MAG: FAD-binding oxidoreductase, partial [Curtobacterium sp.]
MTTVTPTSVEALRAELVALLGERGVSADERTRARASVDEATMSPILSEQLPLGLADLVASPATADDIAATLQAAVRHGVPVT